MALTTAVLVLVFVPFFGSSLSVLPTKRHYGLRSDTESYWDGSAIRDATGMYHLFVSRMTYHCGLSTWQRNSECVHFVSVNPFTGFILAQIVVGPMCHNPTIIFDRDTYLLYYIGIPWGNPYTEYTNCANGTTIGDGGSWTINPCFINVISSVDLINWSTPHNVKSIIHLPICPTNPAPFILNNGTRGLIYRGYSMIDWNFGEYLFIGNSSFNEPLFRIPLEDPRVFQKDKQYFITVSYKFVNESYIGAYTSTEDFINYTPFVPLYSLQIDYIDGRFERVDRRERFSLLSLNSTHGVAYNAVKPFGTDRTYIAAFPVLL